MLNLKEYKKSLLCTITNRNISRLKSLDNLYIKRLSKCCEDGSSYVWGVGDGIEANTFTPYCAECGKVGAFNYRTLTGVSDEILAMEGIIYEDLRRWYTAFGKKDFLSWRLNEALGKEALRGYLYDDESGRFKEEVWLLNDLRHREGGPAYTIKSDCGSYTDLLWYRHGMLHREDGPASIYINRPNVISLSGAKEWRLYDAPMTQKKWLDFLLKMKAG